MGKHITNLETLSQIQYGDKLFVDDNLLSIDNRYLPSIRRYLEGTSREDIISIIINSFNKTFLYLELPKIFPNRSNKLKFFLNRVKELKQLILEAIEGIKILQKTYENNFTKLNNIILWLSNNSKYIINYHIGNNKNYHHLLQLKKN